MAMTEKQIDGVISLFLKYYVSEPDKDKRLKAYVQFYDDFGRNIGDKLPEVPVRIREKYSNDTLAKEFEELSSAERKDMSSGVKIRRLCRADFEQVRELIRSEFGVALTHYDERGIQKYLKSDHSFVASKDDEILGVILADEMPCVDRVRVYIDIFIVASGMRGLGIGHKLYKAVVDAPADSRNASELILKTKKDREAYEIYKHWGFADEDYIYMSQYYISYAEKNVIDPAAKKTRDERIKYILDNYHPVCLSGESSISFEEASRMIEIEVNGGKTEDEAFEVLKYCTVGVDFIEECH